MSLFGQKQATKPTNGTTVANLQTDLTHDELDLIIRLLATTHFPVKEIETLYQTLVKLHQQRELKKQQN